MRFRLPWSRRPAAPDPEKASAPLFSTHMGLTREAARKAVEGMADQLRASAPKIVPGAFDGLDYDGDDDSLKWAFQLQSPAISDVLLAWYGSQNFIGYQTAAILSQHWLIDKALTMPARDAVRNGFTLSMPGREGEVPEIKELEKANRKFRLRYHMQDFVRKGRMFGIRIALFRVDSMDPLYYEKPFNPDGVTPGSYKGIVQVDPYWCVPELDAAAVANPASLHFYEPTWWMIAGRRYHRSHLCIFKVSDVPDILKPTYGYGGVPVPQRIMERVYGAERTANEAPQLAMSKRTTVWNTDIAKLLANQEAFGIHMSNFVEFRDNFGVKINDTDDQMQQFETSLADLDSVIMSQYQIVAAAAGVPATKLLGTTPKGFNATGEYEESSYHEELETVQENDLTPLAERHMLLVLRSEVEPKHGHAPGTLEAVLSWAPLDSPTAKEQAETNKLKAETDQALVNAGALDGHDVRDRVRKDKDSGYHGIAEVDQATLADPLGLNGLTDLLGLPVAPPAPGGPVPPAAPPPPPKAPPVA